jgi:hypothetical protein
MKGKEPMKMVSVVLPKDLAEVVKKEGEKNARKVSQEIRFILDKIYSDDGFIQGEIESFSDYAPDLEVKDSKRQRINMAFEDENLGYLRVISRIEGVSITEYVNMLIAKDMKLRESTVNKAKKVLKN